MDVRDAVAARHSVRAFLDRPVPEAQLRELLSKASHAPSGGNLQPWKLVVLSGAVLTDFKGAIARRISENPEPDPPDYDIYPRPLKSPYDERRRQCGEDMYACLGIAREDKDARRRWVARNYEFFGAPVGLLCFIDRALGSPQWVDLGLYLQSLMLLLVEAGLDSCPQEAWSVYGRTVARHLGMADEWMLFCGMGIGYADRDAPVNRLRTARAPLGEFAELRGFARDA